ncbi:hypothetical protein D1007_05559 [Hordeum vulgare]|nr:hypothetical protein D1007_05559 [Hordeum vulgare]
MTHAIFGRRTRNLQDNCLLKLKGVYVLTEQLYIKSLCAIKVVARNNESVTLVKDVLPFLSTIPRKTGELKRSVARAGATYSLSRALAYPSELDPIEMLKGFPELKADG